MNFAMWKKALTVIPNVSKEEWDKLDIISKWLISTRAAVLVMTFLSAVLAGLFAWHDGYRSISWPGSSWPSDWSWRTPPTISSMTTPTTCAASTRITISAPCTDPSRWPMVC